MFVQKTDLSEVNYKIEQGYDINVNIAEAKALIEALERSLFLAERHGVCTKKVNMVGQGDNFKISVFSGEGGA